MSISRREFMRVSASAATVLLINQARGQAPRRRKEINTLSPSELTSLRAGVTAMSALNRDNYLSWDYQRAVHMIPQPEVGNGLPPDPPTAAAFWRQCKHHTDHFFDWHRWELFYWEEICRQLCGDASFTLPYWDYFSDGHLPAAFRAPPAGQTNVLFHDRNASLNDGSAQLNTIAGSMGWPAIAPTGMTETDLFSFQGFFENNPHDLVHGSIGFDMGAIPTSALDPVFYVHHANIDRYWAKWLRQGGGRVNPGGTWATTPFSFQTVSGVKNPKGGDAGTPETLGYTYDRWIDLSHVYQIINLLKSLKSEYRFLPPRPIPPGPDPGPWRSLGALEGIKLDGHPTSVGVPGLEAERSKLLSQALTKRNVQLALVLYNLKATPFTREGGFVYQVFLVPSQKDLAAGRLKEAVEVGAFSSFSVSAVDHDGHASADERSRLVLPLSAAARSLMAKYLGRDPAFVFVRRGLLVNGKEDRSKMDETLFTMDEIRVEVRQQDAR